MTELDKNGPNMRKFRKADELFYLMKQIKKYFKFKYNIYIIVVKIMRSMYLV